MRAMNAKPPLTAMTVLQPFAHLIASGDKFVENRTWRRWHPPQYFVIHAGKGRRMLSYDYETAYPDLVFGAFVATVFLSKVIHIRDRSLFISENDGYGWLRDHRHVERPYLWIFTHVWPLSTTIPATGAQGLWAVEPSHAALIREEFASTEPHVAGREDIVPRV